MDLGWEPKHPLELFNKFSTDPFQSLEDFPNILDEVFKGAQASHSSARDQQRLRILSELNIPKYQVGDMVMLSTSVFQDHYT